MKNKFSILPSQIIALAAMLFMLATPKASGQIGYDLSFDGDGRFIYNEVGTNETVVAVLELPDGKVVIVGETNYDPDEANNSRIFVIKLNINGTTDNAWAPNGRVYIDTPSNSDVPAAAALQADGKILIAGSQEYSKGTIYRLNTNGSMDISFGTLGKAVIGTESSNPFRNIKIQSNGKIVVSGYGFIDVRFSYLIARFNTNGQLDNTFNPSGTQGYIKFRTNTSNTREDNGAGYGLAIQPDGKIVSCGYNELEDGTVVRLNANGTLDPTFGGGVKYIDFNRKVNLYSLAIQDDGKILVGGTYDFNADLYKAQITRLMPNGNYDISFNNSLSGTGWYGNDFGIGYEMALQCDGKILIGGGTDLFRVNPSGVLDPSFANNGHFDINFNYSPWVSTLLLGATKIYFAGSSHPQSGSSDGGGFVACLNNDIDCGTTPTEALERDIVIKIYPNPVHDLLNIQIGEDSDEVTSITLSDNLGRLIFSNDHFYSNGSSLECDMATLPPGAYYLVVTTAQGRRVLPVMKV